MPLIKLHTLPEQILNAAPEELESILTALQERFSEIHPDWELLFVTVHGHESRDRVAALQSCIDLLSSDKK